MPKRTRKQTNTSKSGAAIRHTQAKRTSKTPGKTVATLTHTQRRIKGDGEECHLLKRKMLMNNNLWDWCQQSVYSQTAAWYRGGTSLGVPRHRGTNHITIFIISGYALSKWHS